MRPPGGDVPQLFFFSQLLKLPTVRATPLRPLPEMTLSAPGSVPPTVLPETFNISMPLVAFPNLFVPAAPTPM